MRMREIIKLRKKAARLDIDLSADTLQHYIDICQCPFCQDETVYKMLPLHIFQMHGITAYQIRKDYGWNRHHKLSSQDTSRLMAEKASRPEEIKAFLSHPNWANIESRYTDGGKRAEGLESDSRVANQPEVKQRFREIMSKLDHHAIALSIPKEIRHLRSLRAAKTIKQHNPQFFRELGKRAGTISGSRRYLIPPEVRSAWGRKAAATVKCRYGNDYHHQLAIKAGTATKQRYAGTTYYHDIGVKSAQCRKAKRGLNDHNTKG